MIAHDFLQNQRLCHLKVKSFSFQYKVCPYRGLGIHDFDVVSHPSWSDRIFSLWSKQFRICKTRRCGKGESIASQEQTIQTVRTQVFFLRYLNVCFNTYCKGELVSKVCSPKSFVRSCVPWCHEDRWSTVMVITHIPIGNRVWCPLHSIAMLLLDDPVSSLFQWRNYERDPCECFWHEKNWRSPTFFICQKWNQRYLEQTHWSLEAFTIQLYKLSEALKWYPQVQRPVERFVQKDSKNPQKYNPSVAAHLQISKCWQMDLDQSLLIFCKLWVSSVSWVMVNLMIAT